MEQPYIQTTDLQELIDWDSIMAMYRCAGGHDDQMKGLFKGAIVLGHWNEGNYQGSVATCVRLGDNRVAIYNDYYGSCSGCDSWEDATDDEVRKLCIDLSNSAYIFPDLESAKAWLRNPTHEENGWNRWGGVAENLLSAIEAGKAS